MKNNPIFLNKKVSKRMNISIIALMILILFINGKEAIHDFETLLPVNIDGKYGYINEKGEMIIKPTFEYAQLFYENRAWVYKNKKFALIDTKGKLLTDYTFDWAWGFSEGLAAVKKGKKWGFADHTGNIVIPLYYDEARSFSENYAAVKKGDAWGYIDKNYKLVIPPQFIEAKEFSDGLGKILIPVGTDKEGRIKVKSSFVNAKGKIINHLEFESALSFKHNLAPVEVNGKWGYADNSGKIVISPEYDFAYPFSGKPALARVRNNEKLYGYIDTTGKVVIPIKYKSAEPFFNGVTFVKEKANNKYIFLINHRGELIKKFDLQSENITSITQINDNIIRLYRDRNLKNPYYLNVDGKYIWQSKNIVNEGPYPQPDWFVITTHSRWLSSPSANDQFIASNRKILEFYTSGDFTNGASSQPESYFNFLKDIDYKQLEKDILIEINKLRTNPKAYIKVLEERRSQIKEDKLYIPGFPTYINLTEGVSAVDEAIEVLKNQDHLPPLSISTGLTKAAKDHVIDQGVKGLIGHGGSNGSSPFERMGKYGQWLITAVENIAYGQKFGVQVIVDLFVDDGVYDRGHRANILNPNYKLIGIACGPHSKIGTISNMDFAGGFKDK